MTNKTKWEIILLICVVLFLGMIFTVVYPSGVHGENENKVQVGHQVAPIPTIQHLGYSSGDYRQEIVQKAYELGGMDLVILMECESGMKPLAIGDNGWSYGLCQMHSYYHDIPQAYYDDRGYQIKYCNEKRLGGTPFYGPQRKIYRNGKYMGQCHDYVKDRFVLNY